MDQIFQFLRRFDKYTKNTDLLVAAGLIGIFSVMIVPLPAFLLDLSQNLS